MSKSKVRKKNKTKTRIETEIKSDYILFKDATINKPFMDISETSIGITNKVRFAVDLFLYLERIYLMPNIKYLVEEKKGRVVFHIHKEYPEKVLENIQEGNLHVKKFTHNRNMIKISFKIVKRSSFEDPAYHENDEIHWLCDKLYHKWLILPESYKILDCNPMATLEYLEYVDEILGDSSYFPFFQHTEKDKVIHNYNEKTKEKEQFDVKESTMYVKFPRIEIVSKWL